MNIRSDECGRVFGFREYGTRFEEENMQIVDHSGHLSCPVWGCFPAGGAASKRRTNKHLDDDFKNWPKNMISTFYVIDTMELDAAFIEFMTTVSMAPTTWVSDCFGYTLYPNLANYGHYDTPAN